MSMTIKVAEKFKNSLTSHYAKKHQKLTCSDTKNFRPDKNRKCHYYINPPKIQNLCKKSQARSKNSEKNVRHFNQSLKIQNLKKH